MAESERTTEPWMTFYQSVAAGLLTILIAIVAYFGESTLSELVNIKIETVQIRLHGEENHADIIEVKASLRDNQAQAFAMHDALMRLEAKIARLCPQNTTKSQASAC